MLAASGGTPTQIGWGSLRFLFAKQIPTSSFEVTFGGAPLDAFGGGSAGSSWPGIILRGWAHTPRGARRSLITCRPRAGRGGAGARPGTRPHARPPTVLAQHGPRGSPERSPPSAMGPWEAPSALLQPRLEGYEKTVMESRLGSSLPGSLVKTPRHSRTPSPVTPLAGKKEPPRGAFRAFGVSETDTFVPIKCPGASSGNREQVGGENALPRYPRPVKSSPSGRRD